MKIPNDDPKWDERVAVMMALVGTLGFWGLLFYRIYAEGLQWLYETNDGVIVMGIIGFVGWYLFANSELMLKVKELPREVGFRIEEARQQQEEQTDKLTQYIYDSKEKFKHRLYDIDTTTDRTRDEIKAISDKLDGLIRRL